MSKLAIRKIKQQQLALAEILPERYDLEKLSETHDFLMKKAIDVAGNLMDDAIAGTITTEEKIKSINVVVNIGKFIELKKQNAIEDDDGLMIDDELIIEGGNAEN